VVDPEAFDMNPESTVCGVGANDVDAKEELAYDSWVNAADCGGDKEDDVCVGVISGYGWLTDGSRGTCCNGVGLRGRSATIKRLGCEENDVPRESLSWLPFSPMLRDDFGERPPSFKEELSLVPTRQRIFSRHSSWRPKFTSMLKKAKTTVRDRMTAITRPMATRGIAFTWKRSTNVKNAAATMTRTIANVVA